jgi:uncharacterized protein (TIGR01777 family)
MKIILAGGSGQIGSILARHFFSKGDEVVVLTRKQPGESVIRNILWDASNLGSWTKELEGADVLINLAGRNVNCRYNAENRKDILESRVNATRVLARAIEGLKKPPSLWLQSSTATIYAHRFDAPNDELTGILGGTEANAPATWRFSIAVAKAWEAEFDAAPLPCLRKLKLRSAMVMSPDREGVFDVLLSLVRKGLGGRAGNGRQYVSWIHYLDFVEAIDWLVAHQELDGAINLCSPNPLPNADFMREIRKASGTKIGLPASNWMLEIGAVFMRTETELILKSRRVIPTRLKQSGYDFNFPVWADAVLDLCQRRNRDIPRAHFLL